MSREGVNLVKSYEGLSLKPYRDPSGIPTIGYGNTFYEDGTKVTMQDAPLTLQRANQLFSRIHGAFSIKVKKMVTSSVNSNQLGALTSLAYNIGINAFARSTVLKRVNANPDDPTIGEAFAMWNKSKGVIFNGLIKRRASEWQLYQKSTLLNVNVLLPLMLFFYTVFTVTL
jgi:lysozyme